MFVIYIEMLKNSMIYYLSNNKINVVIVKIGSIYCIYLNKFTFMCNFNHLDLRMIHVKREILS